MELKKAEIRFPLFSSLPVATHHIWRGLEVAFVENQN